MKADIDLVHVRVKDELKLPDEDAVRASMENAFGTAMEVIPTGPDGQISLTIDRTVKSGGYDLLVTVPHEHTWIDRLMIGSETRELAGIMEIPMLSLPGGV